MNTLDIRVPGEEPSPYHYAEGAHPRAIIVGHKPLLSIAEDQLREMLDVGRLEFLQGFDRVLLLQQEPRTMTPTSYMRTVANRVMFNATYRNAPLVLLGRAVCDVFMANLGVEIREMDGRRIWTKTPSRRFLLPVKCPGANLSQFDIRLLRDALREELPK